MIILKMMKYGIGNQLFAYAYAKYLAQKCATNLNIYFPKDMMHESDYNNALGKFQLKFDGLINKKELIRLSNGKHLINEFFFHLTSKTYRTIDPYIEIEHRYGKQMEKCNILINYDVDHWDEYFDIVRKGTVLVSGYFQNTHYARYLENELKQEIVLVKEYRFKHRVLIGKINTCNSVCVHVRRGDYIKTSLHKVCNLTYYKDAVSALCTRIKNPIFFIFTDDQKYVRDNKMIFDGKEVIYASEIVSANGGTASEELFIMGQCKHFIISNSSFSWWAQFLSTESNKMVFAPNKWYNSDSMKGRLFESSWEYIDVVNSIGI